MSSEVLLLQAAICKSYDVLVVLSVLKLVVR